MGHNDGEMDARRKRMLFRSWHRGMREMDMLLGKFAEQHLEGFSDIQLDRFEAILAEIDPDIYNWLSGREPIPDDLQNDVMEMLKKFTLSINSF
jgi:antitoxin CptB